MINFNLGLTFDSLRTIFRMVFDIFIVWMLLYYAIKIVRTNSRTIQIFKGIALILVVNGVAKFLGLDTVIWLSDQFLNWGFLAIIVVFQPEIRSVLEKLGKSNVFSRLSTLSGNEKEKLVDELVTATMLLSRDQTGALISLEQGHSLNDFIKTGTPINSVVTAELLTSIFVTSTPLHDGAVIIQGDRIACASAYFPPTNLDLPSRYGARHRAAIGISEITDSVTIVISEETGAVSITEGGKILTVNRKQLREYLIRVICGEETEVKNVKSNTPQRQVIIEKEEPEEIAEPVQIIPAQEYIVEEKTEQIVKATSENESNEEKRDTRFDTAILSKLAIKRHDTDEEKIEEEIHVPVVDEEIQGKEKKRFGLFKLKKKEVKESIEDKTFEALDKEEASIKLPKKKERPTPSYPSHENSLKNHEAEMKPMLENEEIIVPDSVIQVDDFNKQEDKTNSLNHTGGFIAFENVRVMGDDQDTSSVDELTMEITSEMTGGEIRKAHLEAIKAGKTLVKAKKEVQMVDEMVHPVLDKKLEDIAKPLEPIKKHDHKPTFKVDFSDKSETANIELTGDLSKDSIKEQEALTPIRNIEDLIHDDDLENQFAMLDTLSIDVQKVTDGLDVKPANYKAGGDQE